MHAIIFSLARLEALKESEFYIAPISYVIGSHYRPRIQENKTIMNHELNTGLNTFP